MGSWLIARQDASIWHHTPTMSQSTSTPYIASLHSLGYEYPYSLSQSGAVGRSQSGKPYRGTYRLTSSTHRLMSTVWSAFSHTVSPRYTNVVVCLCTWSVASLTKMVLFIRFAMRHVVSALDSETRNPNESCIWNDICHHVSKTCSSIWKPCPRRLHSSLPR